MPDKYPVEISTAPAAIGPYSQAVKYGEFIFVSGQLGLDPASGQLIGPDAASQTHRILQSIEAILEASGSALVRVVKTTIFVVDLADFEAVNKVYGEAFPFEPPARSTVQVAALPKGARVEIEAIATIHTEAAHGFGGPGF